MYLHRGWGNEKQLGRQVTMSGDLRGSQLTEGRPEGERDAKHGVENYRKDQVWWKKTMAETQHPSESLDTRWGREQGWTDSGLMEADWNRSSEKKATRADTDWGRETGAGNENWLGIEGERDTELNSFHTGKKPTDIWLLSSVEQGRVRDHRLNDSAAVIWT